MIVHVAAINRKCTNCYKDINTVGYGIINALDHIQINPISEPPFVHVAPFIYVIVLNHLNIFADDNKNVNTTFDAVNNPSTTKNAAIDADTSSSGTNNVAVAAQSEPINDFEPISDVDINMISSINHYSK